MKSRLPQILTLLGAIVAFLPLVAVDYVLDNYVRKIETRSLLRLTQAMTSETQAMVYDGLAAIQTVINDSPSLCTPTFVSNVQKQLQAKTGLIQMLVENRDGVQYCDGFGQTVSYSRLSPTLSIPGQSELISIVQLPDRDLPVLKITHELGSNRLISAFVHPGTRIGQGLSGEMSSAVLLRLKLTDGTDIISFGDSAIAENASANEGYIFASSIADALPVMTEAIVPFYIVRARYADLDVSITVVAALLCAAFLLLAVNYVRQLSLPAIDMERAINQKEFKPFYQPIVDLSTGKVAGCEVLVRWEKRDGKMVPPSVFIEYAEATGMAIPMTLSLMQQVRNDLADLCEDYPDLKIGINLFDGHFANSDIVNDVESIFGGSSVRYRQLVFEITERRPLEDKTAAVTVIGGLQALGCRLAMDDVGTGHSNLAYMQTLGVDIIKIDKVFIDMIGDGSAPIPVLDGLINMASELGTSIVAEGVETPAQAIYLREHGVFQAQGYLFAPALQTSSFIELARSLNGEPELPPQEEAIAEHQTAVAGAETGNESSTAEAETSKDEAA